MNEATTDPLNVISAVVVTVGSLIVWLQSRKHGKTAESNAAEAVEKATEVHTTLTRNNGGSSVKDQLDRIERRQILADERAILQDQRFITLAESVDIMSSRIAKVESSAKVTIVDATVEPLELEP